MNAVTIQLIIAALAAGGPSEDADAKASRPDREMSDIANEAIAACDSVNSFRARIRVESITHNGRAEFKDRSTGTYEQLRDSAILKWRTEMTNKVTAAQDTIHGVVADRKVTIISDGRYAHTLTVSDGKKSVTKNDADRERSVMANRAFFTMVAREKVVRVLADKEIEGHACWVFETRPQRPKRGEPARRRFCVRKDCGVRVKESAYDHTGKRVHITTLTELELNVPIKKKRFLFEAPQGVQIMDLTAQ